MKKDVLLAMIVGLFGTLCFCTMAWANKQNLSFDNISAYKNTPVAVVNDVVITRESFNRALNTAYCHFASSYTPLNDNEIEKLKNTVLEQLINEELLYQESKRRGITVNNNEVQTLIDAEADNFPSNELFLKYLERIGLTERQLREEKGKQLFIKLLTDNISSEIPIPAQSECIKYYDENISYFTNPEKIHVYRIMIRLDEHTRDSEGNDTAWDKISKVKKMLDQDMDFSGLAKGFSNGPHASKGGDMGYLRKENLDPVLERIISSLSVGEISKPFKTTEGYNVIMISDKRPGHVVPFSQALCTITKQLMQDKTNARINSLLEQLKDSAVINVIHKNGGK